MRCGRGLRPLRAVGVLLIAVGALLLILFVPCEFYFALCGLALVGLGVLLLRMGK